MSGPSVLQCSGAVSWATGRTSSRKMVARLLVVTIWSCARLIAPVVTTTSIILSSNEIEKGDVLVPSNPDPSGKWPLKRRERVSGPSHKKLFPHLAYRLPFSYTVISRMECVCMFVCHPTAAGPTIDQDRHFQACFPVFSTILLELAATDSSDQ